MRKSRFSEEQIFEILSEAEAGRKIMDLCRDPRRLRAVLVACLLVCAGGCATFKPSPVEEIPFQQRSVSQERAGLTVTVAVPTKDEAARIFGVNLAKQLIQPVWIDIRNDSDRTYFYMAHGLDPAYFSAREAAYKSKLRFRAGTNAEMSDYFADLAIKPRIDPGARQSGFAFTNMKLGVKNVRIRLFSEGQVEDYEFFVQVPGFQADWHEVDWDGLYDDDEIVHLETPEQLFEVIMGLPCCTTRKDGSGKGDPLNIVVISGETALDGFTRAGWDETEVLTFASGWRTFRAFFGGTYKYSPMSALYVFGRPQDIGLQKARDTIHERNHLRLWMGPWRYQGREVWVGSITRDIGVYFTRRAWNLTTHAIDPDVDEARNYLTEDLATAGAIEKLGTVPGVGPATPEEPHRNLMYAPWWTEGNREVYLLSDEPVPLTEVRFLPWEEDLLAPGR